MSKFDFEKSQLRSFATLLFAIVLFLGIIKCTYSFDKYSPSTLDTSTPSPVVTDPTTTPDPSATASPAPITAGTFTISAGSATIDTPSDIVLSSGTLQLKTLTTENWGCTYTNAASTNTGIDRTPNGITSSSIYYGVVFTPPTYLKVNSANLYLILNGSPSGDIYASIYNSNGTNPTTLIRSSSLVSFDFLSPSATMTNFAFSTAIELSASNSYALLNGNQAGWTGYDATSNRYDWVGTSVTASECTNFSVVRKSTDSGSTWSANTLKHYFTLNVDKHATSGAASWIVQGIGGTWDMSTFTFAENQNGKTTGTITYDIGSGSSAITPTYSSSSLTKAQVQALTDLAGSYLYIRANFSITAQGYNNATLGNGSISSY